MEIIDYEKLLVDDGANVPYMINKSHNIMVILQTKDNGVSNKEIKG